MLSILWWKFFQFACRNFFSIPAFYYVMIFLKMRKVFFEVLFIPYNNVVISSSSHPILEVSNCMMIECIKLRCMRCTIKQKKCTKFSILFRTKSPLIKYHFYRILFFECCLINTIMGINQSSQSLWLGINALVFFLTWK